MLCSIIWQVLQLEYSLTCFKSYFNKWKKLSIGIDFGIGIDQNSWYRYRPKFMVSVSVSTKKASIAHHYGKDFSPLQRAKSTGGFFDRGVTGGVSLF